MNIYQLFVRTFGNKNTGSIFDGDKSQNGCGTFASINNNALDALKKLGITHIWLTGVIKHSSLTAYPELGIKSTNPLITKGKAGSPYSIMDYYDIDPDLAINPQNRIAEFELSCHLMFLLTEIPDDIQMRINHETQTGGNILTSIVQPDAYIDFQLAIRFDFSNY